MVVDNLDDIGALDTGGRLADLIVVDEDDLLLHLFAVAHNWVHVIDEYRLGDVVLLQNPGAFHRQRAEAGGHVLNGIGLAIASGQRILQVRVAHRCGDGVVVGVAVTHDEDFGRHECPFLPTYGFDAV